MSNRWRKSYSEDDSENNWHYSNQSFADYLFQPYDDYDPLPPLKCYKNSFDYDNDANQEIHLPSQDSQCYKLPLIKKYLTKSIQLVQQNTNNLYVDNSLTSSLNESSSSNVSPNKLIRKTNKMHSESSIEGSSERTNNSIKSLSISFNEKSEPQDMCVYLYDTNIFDEPTTPVQQAQNLINNSSKINEITNEELNNNCNLTSSSSLKSTATNIDNLNCTLQKITESHENKELDNNIFFISDYQIEHISAECHANANSNYVGVDASTTRVSSNIGAIDHDIHINIPDVHQIQEHVAIYKNVSTNTSSMLDNSEESSINDCEENNEVDNLEGQKVEINEYESDFEEIANFALASFSLKKSSIEGINMIKPDIETTDIIEDNDGCEVDKNNSKIANVMVNNAAQIDKLSFLQDERSNSITGHKCNELANNVAPSVWAATDKIDTLDNCINDDNMIRNKQGQDSLVNDNKENAIYDSSRCFIETQEKVSQTMPLVKKIDSLTNENHPASTNIQFRKNLPILLKNKVRNELTRINFNKESYFTGNNANNNNNKEQRRDKKLITRDKSALNFKYVDINRIATSTSQKTITNRLRPAQCDLQQTLKKNAHHHAPLSARLSEITENSMENLTPTRSKINHLPMKKKSLKLKVFPVEICRPQIKKKNFESISAPMFPVSVMRPKLHPLVSRRSRSPVNRDVILKRYDNPQLNTQLLDSWYQGSLKLKVLQYRKKLQ